ncbi:Uncharacterised protein [Candidatus Anstonella stagnisolia]|nr:Uncharacterised protein [Candidatus Anstonella stagnisolia]
MQTSTNTTISSFRLSFFFLALLAVFAGSAFAAPSINITLVAPANDTWSNGTNNTIAFIYNYTGGLNDTIACALMINGVNKTENISLAGNATYLNTAVFSNSSIADGTLTWNINCTNATANISALYPFKLHLDTGKPNIITSTFTNLNNSYGNLSFNVTDNISTTTNCSVYFDNNATMITYNASVTNNSLTNFVLSTAGLSESNHTAELYCFDNGNGTAGNMNINHTSIAFIADRSVPNSVTLVSPSASAWVKNSSTFSFTVVDNVTPTNMNCTLYVNGTALSTLTNVANNSVANFTSVNLDPAFSTGDTLNWSVFCLDAGLNNKTSANRLVKMDFLNPSNGTQVAPTAINYNYSTTATFSFSVVYNDSHSGVDKVWVLINQTTNLNSSEVTTTAFTNYSLSQNGSTTTYNATIGPLSAGNYTYTFYANDTVGNVNYTAAAYFTIAKIATTCNFTGSTNVTIPTNVSITFACTNGDFDRIFNITRNSTDENASAYNASSIANGASKLLVPGWYIYNMTMNATQNYTAGSNFTNVTVHIGTPTLNITSSAGFTITYTDLTNITGTGCPSGEGSVGTHCMLNISNSTFSSLLK